MLLVVPSYDKPTVPQLFQPMPPAALDIAVCVIDLGPGSGLRVATNLANCTIVDKQTRAKASEHPLQTASGGAAFKKFRSIEFQVK